MESENEEILTGFPNYISYNSTKTIIEQMEKCICKIKLGKDKQGTGFFCLIPDGDQPSTVFITANHIINEELLNDENGRIRILIEEENETRIINLNNRKKYTSPEDKYDITIIEIKEEDNIKNYLELDDDIKNDLINNNNRNQHYVDKTLYIIQYPKGNLSVSYGILSGIYEDKKYNFVHKCSTLGGASGSPILDEISHKVIGVHIKGGGNKEYNIGSFLNDAIKEFKQLNIIKKVDKNDEIINIDETVQKQLLKDFNKKYNMTIKKNCNSIDLSTKQIGNEGLENICKIEFNELKYLYLFKNNISDIKPLENARFQNLEVLGVSFNSISDISILKKVNFINLKELNLGNNNISDISVLKNVNFDKLEKLYLDNNKISDIDVLDQTNFEKLKELKLNNNNISNINILENVEFPKLKKLNLEGNKIKDIDILEKVDFKELNNLNLFNNHISDISVFNKAKFDKLKTLNVNSNPLDKVKNMVIIAKLKMKKGLIFIANFKDK